MGLWDVYTGRELAVLRGHENEVNSVALSPGGTGLASTSEGFGSEVRMRKAISRSRLIAKIKEN